MDKAESQTTYSAKWERIKNDPVLIAKERERTRIAMAKWRAKNPEKSRAAEKKYRDKNPEKRKAAVLKWREKNKDRHRATFKKYQSENLEYFRIHAQNRRNKEREGGLSNGIVSKLMSLQYGKCACCTTTLSKIKFHLDHIMPLALGGEHVDSNIQLLCQPCNQAKHAKHPIEFMRSRGLLL